MADIASAYVELISEDASSDAQKVTIVIRYGGKEARIELTLDGEELAEQPITDVIRQEMLKLQDALEDVSESITGILTSRPDQEPSP